MAPTDPNDIDDLLGTPVTPAEKEAILSLADGGVPVETPEQARIRELEAQLARAHEKAQAVEKSNEDKDLEHNAAVRSTSAFDRAGEKFEDADEGDDYIVIHFLQDGFTFADRVWYAGQTVRFQRGGKAYTDTVDRNGVSWLDDISISAQRKKFGKVILAEGEYDGPPFDDEISRQDAARGVAAPIIKIN